MLEGKNNTFSLYFHAKPLSSAEASMIDAPSFFPSSPARPLSPLFYLPPPLCGGESLQRTGQLGTTFKLGRVTQQNVSCCEVHVVSV